MTHATHNSRGSAYVFILGVTLIVTVLGMGALTISRVSAKAVGSGNDWEVAGSLAFSATEQAISRLNDLATASPTSWRGDFVSGQIAFTKVMDRGTLKWAIKDEIDGNLSADYLRSFRLYGIGTVGSVTRVYSVQVLPGGSALDVLRTALHSSGAVTLGGTTNAVNGPYSSNANVGLSGTVNGAIEAASTSGSASGTQSITTGAAQKRMPSTTVITDLARDATIINYSAISGGKIQKCLLSPASNPFGATNAKGIYVLSLAGQSSLSITNCRIVGTLLLTDASNCSITIDGPVEWEPADAGYPILVISGQKTNVKVTGSTTWLSESSAGANFNPAGTPFAGASNTDTADDYPPQYRGIIHFIGDASSSLEFKDNAYVSGTVIASCPVKASTQTTFVRNPAYSASPPFGYATGDALVEVPGTWRWDGIP